MLARPRQLFVILSSLALFACSGLRCSGGPPERAAAVKKPRPDLRLLVLTDPKGYLEPCGCQRRPLGGVDKLAHTVGQLRADGVPTLLLAAGDLLFGTEVRPEDKSSFVAQAEWGAETLAEVWSKIGLDAATPGKLDLEQRPELSQKLIEKSGFPWLIDNLDLGPRPERHRARVVRAGALKVGVVGLVAPDPGLRLPPGPAIQIDLQGVARERIGLVRAQGAQLVVALVSGDRRAAREVGAAGADVVVMGGLDLEHPLPPAQHGQTIFVHAGRQGQRLLQLDLALTQGEPHDESAWTRRETQKDLKQKVEALREKIAAWEKAKADAKDLAAQRARLSEMERAAEDSPAPNYTGRWYSAEVHELSPEVPRDASISQVMARYDQRVNEHNRVTLAERKPARAKEGSPHYVGSEACKSCHESAYGWWRNTKHGKAYATLENVHKEFNLSCVACHVTGYNQPGGSTVTHVTDLQDVGCESCHGPSSQHLDRPEQKGLIARDTPESVCVGCHTPEHSDRFVYDAFKTLLVVPGHGLPAAKAKGP